MQPSLPWSSSVSLFVIGMMAIIHSLKFTVPFSFAVPLFSFALPHCHSLSLFVTRCTTRCATRCTTLCHLLPFVVTHCTTRCTTRCHLMPFVVTWCTTGLSFYKRSCERVNCEIVTTFCIKICMLRLLNDRMCSISSYLYEEISKSNKSHTNRSVTALMLRYTVKLMLN